MDCYSLRIRTQASLTRSYHNSMPYATTNLYIPLYPGR